MGDRRELKSLPILSAVTILLTHSSRWTSFYRTLIETTFCWYPALQLSGIRSAQVSNEEKKTGRPGSSCNATKLNVQLYDRSEPMANNSSTFMCVSIWHTCRSCAKYWQPNYLEEHGYINDSIWPLMHNHARVRVFPFVFIFHLNQPWLPFQPNL